MKHQVLSLRLLDGTIESDNDFRLRSKIKLPDGCIGFCLVFESKKAAADYWGRNSPVMRVKFGPPPSSREK